MMQSELLIQTISPNQSYFNPYLDYYESDHEFLSSINSTPENSIFSSESYGCVEYPSLGYDQMQNPSPVYSDPQNINTLDDVCRWLCDDDDQETEETQSIITIGDIMEETDDRHLTELESQTGLQNLLKAYADGISMGQMELAKVIVRCINQKINPTGQTLERIVFNLFQSDENQEEYLKQESMRNFKIAFRVFYEIFPYGRFAHFTANSAILEAVPTSIESIHIVDFDLGEGSQWPPIIEAIARMKKSLIITSIKLDQDSQFDQTRWHLCNFARTFGLQLKVQEMSMTQLVQQTDQTTLGSEYIAFNCMVGLPHMRTTRPTSQVMNFLNLAKGVLSKHKGIITFGDGEEGPRTGTHLDFSSFFNKNLAHYNALYESMEWGFPSYLNEARLAMETLFVSPFIKSKSWYQKWDEGKQNNGFLNVLGLKGVKMSKERWDEARELVKEGETPYKIGIEGGNEMVLEWNGTPMVKVSAWVCIKDSEL